MLHIVKHHRSLSEAIAHATGGDALLLVEDGLYAAMVGHKANKELGATSIPVYCLTPDARARGLTIDGAYTEVDFAGFVTLTEQQPCSLTWE